MAWLERRTLKADAWRQAVGNNAHAAAVTVTCSAQNGERVFHRIASGDDERVAFVGTFTIVFEEVDEGLIMQPLKFDAVDVFRALESLRIGDA